jgi:hypothetical protein
MDSFQTSKQEGIDSYSESSNENNLLYQLIFGQKDSKKHAPKPDKHEYLVSVTTHLKDPVFCSRTNLFIRMNAEDKEASSDASD